MKVIYNKLRLIYLPFIIIAICFIVLYTFLNWLLLIKLNVFSIKEDIIQFWIPLILPWIPVLIWIRPRAKLLNFKGRSDNLPFLFLLIPSLAMTIPTMLAQKYIEAASGKLTELSNINALNKQEPTKYYKIKNFFIDTSNLVVHTSFDLSGKHNGHLNMHLYLVLPILECEADTNKSNCLAWLGIEYSDYVLNGLDSKEKEEKFLLFRDKSERDFEKRNLNQFEYFDRVGNNNDGEAFKKAIKKSPKFNSKDSSVLLGVNEAFEDRNGNRLGWILGVFGTLGGIWFLILYDQSFNELKLNRFMKDKTTMNNNINNQKKAGNIV